MGQDDASAGHAFLAMQERELWVTESQQASVWAQPGLRSDAPEVHVQAEVPANVRTPSRQQRTGSDTTLYCGTFVKLRDTTTLSSFLYAEERARA